MSLFKVYESSNIAYREQPEGGCPSCSYHPEIAEGDYMESLNVAPSWIDAVWAARGEASETTDGHTKIYVLYYVATIDWPSWGVDLAAFDGQSGDLLWTDRRGIPGVGPFSHIDSFFQDTDNRTWSFSQVFGCYRYGVHTGDGIYSETAGMPNFAVADKTIGNSEWLDADGLPYPYTVTKVLAVLPRENRAILLTGGSKTVVHIQDYTTKKELHSVIASYGVEKGFAIDGTTFYGVSINGLINVIDYKNGAHKGFLSLGVQFQGSHISVGYDPVYRRMLAIFPAADSPGTGACNLKLEGFRMSPVPSHLVKPIPLRTPRKGRVIPVYSRVVGDAAEGIAGVGVKAILTGSNTIAPEKVVTDAVGEVQFLWDCDVAGTDIDNIQFDIEYEEGLEGLSPGIGNPQVGVPPDSVESVAMFKPGWWLYTQMSDDPPATKWDAYMDGYSSEAEIPVIGVLQEYKWTDFENSTPSSFDFSKIDADIAYLSNLGRKLIISIKLTSESNSDIWVPADMLTGEAYPQAQDALSLVTGRSIWNLPNVNDSGEGWAPIIWDNAVSVRLRTLLAALVNEYATDLDVVGIAMGDSRYSYSDFIAADVPGDETYLEARLTILTLTDVLTSKMIWEFGVRDAHPHLRNAEGVGLNIAPSVLYMGDLVHNDVRHALQYGDSDEVAFGYVVDPGAWTRDDNKLCTDGNPQANAYQMTFGGADVVECYMDWMDTYRPMFVFWYPGAGNWSGTDGIEEVCQTTILSRVRTYLGV